MDVVSVALIVGRRLRLLTVIDLFTREWLGNLVGQSLKDHDVQEALTAIARFRGIPEMLETDNGSEYAGKVMDRWTYDRNMEIDFSWTRKRADNPTVESFNGRLRHERLNENWFLPLADAREKLKRGGRSLTKADPIPRWRGAGSRTMPENVRFHEEIRSNWSRIPPTLGGLQAGKAGARAPVFHPATPESLSSVNHHLASDFRGKLTGSAS